MKWAKARKHRTDYYAWQDLLHVMFVTLVICLVVALVIALLLVIMNPRVATAGDIVNFRRERRLAAVVIRPEKVKPPYLANWIHQVSRSGNPVTDTQRFVVAAIPTALAAEKKYGIPAAFLLSQAIYESGHGTSRLAVAGHNYFGVTYQGHGAPIYIGGIAYQRFTSMAASFDQQGHMLTSPSHSYQSALKYKNNVYRYAQAVQRLGYCSSRNYAAMIREIVEDFALEAKP